MEKIKTLLPATFLLIIILVVYHAWFLPGILSGTDLGMTFHSMYFNDYLYPYAWYWNQGLGLGGHATSLLWIYMNFAVTKTIFGQILGMPWEITERLAYLFPYLILGISSSIVLAKNIFPKNPFLILVSLIFLVNSYILMVVGGGQLWIFLSYAISPLVLYLFIKENNSVIDSGKWDLGKSFFLGLIFSLLFLIEIRTAYIVLFAASLYWLLKIYIKQDIRITLISLMSVFIVPGILTVLIHAFWVLPTLITGQNALDQLGSAYNSADAVKFFSFAKFENSIALLHPNWPENIFGKTYFMRFEFLVMPLLAFSSLLFLKKGKDNAQHIYILFFCILGLLGAYLAKGANEPFGNLYIWLFNNFPGFVMFRDPTKWYLLIALSYSVLIPFSIWRIYVLLGSGLKFKTANMQPKIKKLLSRLFIVIIVICLLYSVKPALLGNLGGTFKTTNIPAEYFKLESYFTSRPDFFRTFWFPTAHRFGLNSKEHPLISGRDLLRTNEHESLVKMLADDKDILRNAAVRYVVVPYDSEGEIFLKERKYDEESYLKTIESIRNIPYLKQINGFGKIGVFEVSNPKSRFWSNDPEMKIESSQNNPTEYVASLVNAKKGDLLVFSESFDRDWLATTNQYSIPSEKFDQRYNSFRLVQDGDYILRIYYKGQDMVNTGVIISILSLVVIISGLVLFRVKK